MPIKIAKVEKCFKSAGPQPNGLQAVADGLWCIDQVDHKVYKLDDQTGEVLFEAQTGLLHSSGITLGGGYLWIASTYEAKIAKLDPQTGRTITKYDSPGGGVVSWQEGVLEGRVTGAHGLEWQESDGFNPTALYVASPPSQMIHVMDPDSWQELYRFRVPGLRVHGIAWENRGRLWVADTSAGTVNLLDIEDGRIYEVIRVEAPNEVHGLTMHKGTLWYADAHTGDIGRLIVDEDE